MLRRPIHELIDEARWIGLQPLPTRPGGPILDTLRPSTRESAHPRSLSARFGAGTQPLHTDGANHQAPPEFVFLQSGGSERGTARTRLLRTSSLFTDDSLLHAARQGVFQVGAGRTAFTAHALETNGDLRFDPGCMRPLDPLSRGIVHAVNESALTAEVFEWSGGEHVLVIDNRRVLHGRADDDPCQDRAMRRLMMKRSG